MPCWPVSLPAPPSPFQTLPVFALSWSLVMGGHIWVCLHCETCDESNLDSEQCAGSRLNLGCHAGLSASLPRLLLTKPYLDSEQCAGSRLNQGCNAGLSASLPCLAFSLPNLTSTKSSVLVDELCFCSAMVIGHGWSYLSLPSL